MADPVMSLAVYLTGARASIQSMNLELGGEKRREAEAFFALRAAFNLSGYITADEACELIAATLQKGPGQ